MLMNLYQCYFSLNYKKMLWRIVCLSTFSLLTFTTLLSQDGGFYTRRVDIENNKNAIHYEGKKVTWYEPHEFFISLKKKQVLNIQFEGSGFYIELSSPKNKKLKKLRTTTGLKIIRIKAKKSGDYRLEVFSICCENRTYSLEISVQ